MKNYIKELSLLSFFIAFAGVTMAQNVSISGSLKEKDTDSPIEFATIQLLNPKDSVAITGATTNASGRFTLNAKKAKQYILKASFMGYEDQFKNISGEANLNVGTITLAENSVLLKEASVEAKAIEIAVKGDTIEYNADSYKVAENAALEELLKKMPGVEIDTEGKITINGKEIKKILVDGKEFFSDDPKVASKNLPAKMIEKLQVLDQKSDMALMTGFDDGEETPVINLQVKPGMKRGIFGNAFMGVGNEGKYEGNAFVAIAQDNTTISLMGGTNNTNNAGASDLAGAMFGGGGGRGMSFGGGRGITKTTNIGVNVAHEIKDKLKLSTDVRVMERNNYVTSSSNRVYTSNINPGFEDTNSTGDNRNKSFAGGMRAEWTPDKDTKIIFSPHLEFNTDKRYSESHSLTQYEESSALYDKSNNSYQNYDSKGNGNRLSGNLDFSRKLGKAGRVVSMGFQLGGNKSKSKGVNYNKIEYIGRLNDSIIDQLFSEESKSHTWRATASYVEPLSNNYFLETAYRISGNIQNTDKKTFNNANLGVEGADHDYSLVDTTNTRYVQNEFINQNISLKIRKQAEKYNWMMGFALDPSHSKTTLHDPANPNITIPTRSYLNVTPIAQFNYLPNKNTNLRVNYSANTREPTSLMLYDGIYSRNGLNTTSGNPNLKPSFASTLNLRFRKSIPEKGSFLMLIVNGNSTKNAIVTTSQINTQTGGKDSSYANVNGNKGANARFMFNTPLKWKNWSVSSMSYAAYRLDNTLIDDEKNRAKILNFQENIGVQFRSQYFDFALRVNASYNNMKNTISKSNNNTTWNYGGIYDMTLYLGEILLKQGATPFWKGFNIESDINYKANAGFSSGYKQKEWLWNASISKDLFSNSKGTGTIRFKMYDILNQRSNYSQNYTATYREENRTNTIGQYFMATFIYKFQIFGKGMSAPNSGMPNRGAGGRPPHRMM